MDKKGFIIFGWGHTKTKDYGATLPQTCTNCNNKIYSHLVKISKWFDLFFIPIFPYDTSYYLLCPICNNGYELTKQGMEIAEELQKVTGRFLNKDINEKEYSNNLNIYVKRLKKYVISPEGEYYEELPKNIQKDKTKKEFNFLGIKIKK